MNPKRFGRIMRAEIGKLRREGTVDGPTYGALMALYPSTAWDYAALGRWFLVFGAISAASGVLILGSTLFELTLRNLAIALSLVIAGCAVASWRMRSSHLVWTKRSIELLGAITLIGLSFTLGVMYSSGSGNWPALLLIDLVILLPLAYALHNLLLLTLSVVVFFTWFGGVTGYASGWGVYWFGMNYPLRFFMAGVAMAGIGLAHRRAERAQRLRYEGFFKVWLASGLFFSEMALWLMSLFGNYGEIFSHWVETAGELFFFNTTWAAFNLLALTLGSRYGVRILRGHAVTFLVIQAYTLYFWKIADDLGFIMATFIAGGVTLGVVFHLESKRRAG